MTIKGYLLSWVLLGLIFNKKVTLSWLSSSWKFSVIVVYKVSRVWINIVLCEVLTSDNCSLIKILTWYIFLSKCAWKACFPILLAQGKVPASGSMHPSRWIPPSRENKIKQGWPGSPLAPSEGAFQLMHGHASIIGWSSRLLDIIISTYIAQFMGCVISRIHYGLKVVFYFRHFTVFHYHHYARLMAGTEHTYMSVEHLVEVTLQYMELNAFNCPI